MRIELHEILVRDVVNGYIDSAENGVVGYGGKLNIRPAFQREFIYQLLLFPPFFWFKHFFE